MQITKEQIIEVLNGYAYQQKSFEPDKFIDKFIIDADFSSVADEILTLLQSSDKGEQNESKADVMNHLDKEHMKVIFNQAKSTDVDFEEWFIFNYPNGI